MGKLHPTHDLPAKSVLAAEDGAVVIDAPHDLRAEHALAAIDGAVLVHAAAPGPPPLTWPGRRPRIPLDRALSPAASGHPWALDEIDAGECVGLGRPRSPVLAGLRHLQFPSTASPGPRRAAASP